MQRRTVRFDVKTGRWAKFRIWLSGKPIAILGENDVGKTTLFRFLTEGTVPEKYHPTQGTLPRDGGWVKVEGLSVIVGKSMDVSGLEWAVEEWKPALRKAKILIYLIRADRLLSGDAETAERVKRDGEQLREWVQAASALAHVFVIGNHADEIPGYDPSNGTDVADLRRRLQAHTAIQYLKRQLRTERIESVPVLLGSMQTPEGAADLVHAIFSSVSAGA